MKMKFTKKGKAPAPTVETATEKTEVSVKTEASEKGVVVEKSTKTEKSTKSEKLKGHVVKATSSVDVTDAHEYSKEVMTNKIPERILPDEIPTARLILRRDRVTHCEEIGAAVMKMRSNDKAYDCVVICGTVKIPAHRAVLISHSKYFEKILFESGDKLMVDVATDGIPPEGLKAILDYMYSGELKVTFENAVDTLSTASVLQMPQLVERASDFINTLLADENLMTTLELAERTGSNLLYSEGYKRLAKHFYVQTKLSGFLLWDIENVVKLLSSDHIVIETELHVFTVAVRWMLFKESDRRKHFKQLMNCVRWVYMTTEEVMSCIDQEPELLKHHDVLGLLIDATWYTTLKHYNFTWKDYVIPLPRIASLRKEDPDVVVQRIRVSLANRHHSYDHVWNRREPKSAFMRENKHFWQPGRSHSRHTSKSRSPSLHDLTSPHASRSHRIKSPFRKRSPFKSPTHSLSKSHSKSKSASRIRRPFFSKSRSVSKSKSTSKSKKHFKVHTPVAVSRSVSRIRSAFSRSRSKGKEKTEKVGKTEKTVERTEKTEVKTDGSTKTESRSVSRLKKIGPAISRSASRIRKGLPSVSRSVSRIKQKLPSLKRDKSNKTEVKKEVSSGRRRFPFFRSGNRSKSTKQEVSTKTEQTNKGGVVETKTTTKVVVTGADGKANK